MIPVTARVARRTVVDANGCHVFQGAKTNGYGRVRNGGRDGQDSYAHRIMYEAANGPIPAGLHVDHLCRNRACNRRAAAANDNGERGVYLTQASTLNPWMASMTVAGRSVHIGLFATKEAALAARHEAVRTADPDRRTEIEAEVKALQDGAA